MKGESNLSKLLALMSPELTGGEYVFCTVRDGRYGDFANTSPIATFAEAEGLTLVLLKETAEEAGLSFDGVFRRITLGVHSSLDAVGLTAAVAGQLAEQGIAANVFAGYFHDHVFVPSPLAQQAIGILSTHENN